MTTRIGTAAAREDVSIRAGNVTVPGILTIPPHPSGLVLFAHGAGSSFASPSDLRLAAALREAGIGTLVFDLLAAEESGARATARDIPRLADRLAAAARWAEERHPGLPLGYFGADTGAAAALFASAEAGIVPRAIVCRGGDPGLARESLPRVTAPTLLIVGERDEARLEPNRVAYRAMTCPRHLAIIPGAGHLFAEGRSLDQVGALARNWFVHHLVEEPSWYRPRPRWRTTGERKN